MRCHSFTSTVFSPAFDLPASSGQVSLSRVLNSDTGLRLRTHGTSVTISGMARGPYSCVPGEPNASPAELDQVSDYFKMQDVRPGLSLSFDMDRMPQFDTTHSCAAKNAWWSAHNVSISTTKRQTAESVAKCLAAMVNANRDYVATVEVSADRSATLRIQRR